MLMVSGKILERIAKDGNSPVRENHHILLYLYLSTSGKENPEGSRQDYTAKAKYLISPIVYQYREGKVKSSEVIAVKQNLKPFCLQRVRAPVPRCARNNLTPIHEWNTNVTNTRINNEFISVIGVSLVYQCQMKRRAQRGAGVMACFLQNEPTTLRAPQTKSFWDRVIGKPSVKSAISLLTCVRS